VILGIESSCDDTAAAIVRGDGHVLAHKIASQVGKLVLAGIQIASQVGKLILAGIHKRRAKKSDQYRELHRNVISKCLLTRLCLRWGSYYWQASTKEGQRSLINIGSCTGM
jgi:N6-L-threonylcarbamoyladenine synthase